MLELEVSSIQQELRNIHKDYDPKIAFITVNKRISEKFYQEDKQVRNPDSGTIIAIDKEKFDFYLIAQNVTQGTATPTYYRCLMNTTSFGCDLFYTLTYNLCFNYFNWTGAVRVPAPAQYAHKLAYLIGETF